MFPEDPERLKPSEYEKFDYTIVLKLTCIFEAK
jgi:hypothetical protein